MAKLVKLVYLNSDGKLNRSPDGAIANIGGISGSTFTVGGKGLLFDDGTSTSGSGAVFGGGSGGSGGGTSTLQAAYDISLNPDGQASIALANGKDLIIYDANNPAAFFSIAAATGDVTISGNLNVLGSTTTINTTVQQGDHWTLTPILPGSVGLAINPFNGNVPTANLIDVKNVYNGPTVFAIQPNGTTVIQTLSVTGNETIIGNLAVVGSINGIDIVNLDQEVLNHLTQSSIAKHAASEISVTPVPVAPGATNVQQALNALGTAVQYLTGTAGVVNGFEYQQLTPAAVWDIQHNMNTKRVQWSLWDEHDESIIADQVSIIDANNMRVSFGMPQAGRFVIMGF